MLITGAFFDVISFFEGIMMYDYISRLFESM